jgi:hypothetical protein
LQPTPRIDCVNDVVIRRRLSEVASQLLTFENPPLEQLGNRLHQSQIRPFGDQRQYPLRMLYQHPLRTLYQRRDTSSTWLQRSAPAFHKLTDSMALIAHVQKLSLEPVELNWFRLEPKTKGVDYEKIDATCDRCRGFALFLGVSGAAEAAVYNLDTACATTTTCGSTGPFGSVTSHGHKHCTDLLVQCLGRHCGQRLLH